MMTLVIAITTAGHTALQAVPDLPPARCAHLADIARAEAEALRPAPDRVVVTCTGGNAE